LLEGYRRKQVKNAVYPGMIKSSGHSVQGVVYFNVDAEDMIQLDYF
jgi:hypothetical protein